MTLISGDFQLVIESEAVTGGLEIMESDADFGGLEIESVADFWGL